MSMEEARAHRRHQMSGPCIVRSAIDGRILGDWTEDVSYSGVRVRASADAVRLGERVQLSLQIPGSNLWVHGEGKIRRAIVGRRAGDPGPALGVRIDKMDGMSRILLTSVASQMPLVPAGRGGRRDYAEAVARIGRES